MSTIPVYTIGYGSRSLDEFVRALQTHDIEYVIDVRSIPYSRFKPEFAKTALEASLREQGIRYLYLGENLGGQPKDRDCYEDDKVIYARVQDKPFYRAGIDRVQKAFRQQRRIVLMCSEGRPGLCHRSKLIAKSLIERGIPVSHIDENDVLRSQDDVMAELTEGQLSLFGDQDFTSRKRYRAALQSEEETGNE